jgi:hypothetical protein
MGARNTDPETSHESAVAFHKHVSNVNARIIEIVRASGHHGRTQSEAVALMPEYKAGSITPRFSRLVKRGLLVLIRVGTTKPTKASPLGRPRYITRHDEETNRDVNIYWVSEIAPVHQTLI